MTELWLACLIWLGTHLGISSTPLRARMVKLFGDQGFLGVYSLVATASLVYLIWAYLQAPRFDYLWLPNPDLYWVAKLTMPIAFIFLLGGFMVRNPSMVGANVDDPDVAKNMATGVTRITRHPFQWSVIIWGVGHVIANGDTVSILFFTTFVTLSFVGAIALDVKKSKAQPQAWEAYASVTSNVPFVALLTGRNQLQIGELLYPTIAGFALYVLVYWAHEWLTGAVIV